MNTIATFRFLFFYRPNQSFLSLNQAGAYLIADAKEATGAPKGTRALKFINLTRQTEIGANSYYLEVDDQSLFWIRGCIRKRRGRSSAEFQGSG